MPHTDILRIRLLLESGGVTVENIDTDPVPRGEVWRIDFFSAEDLTTALTEFRVGILRGTVFSPLVEQDSPAAATLFWQNDVHRLGEGEQLRLRATGATSGDQIEFHVNGLRLHHSDHLERRVEEAQVEEAVIA